MDRLVWEETPQHFTWASICSPLARQPRSTPSTMVTRIPNAFSDQ